MTSKENDICPLGSEFQHYWDRLTEREKQMKFDKEGLFSLALESVALEIAKKTPGDLVVDAFCGVGGMAIGFARAGKKVIAIDSSSQRLEMACYNASLFNVSDEIEFLSGDCTEIIVNFKPDSIFLDPPWGGTDYNEIKGFKLSNFQPDGFDLLKLSFSVARSVVFRLPKNFDLDELRKFDREYEIQKNFLGKRFLHYCVYFS